MSTIGDVSRETSERLAVFEALLRRWNGRINLIGRGTVGQIGQRHITDSLRLIDHLPATGTIADLGSGAGFPGLVLAIASGRPVTLIEADVRKAAFLREAARVTGADATVVASRIEDSQMREIDIVTARALAPLRLLCAYAYPLLAPSGVCFFLKGAQVERELTEADAEWQMSATRHHSRVMREGCVLELRHLKRREQAA